MNDLKIKEFLPKKIIKDYSGSQERELYGTTNTMLSHCTFLGPGESPVKACNHVVCYKSRIKARYAFWENKNLVLNECLLATTDRAPLWYTHSFVIKKSRMYCPKGLRECSDMKIVDSLLHGTECLWQINRFEVDNLDLVSYYPFLECNYGKINKLKMKGKYSFQHCHDIEITNSNLDTKDAFWHSKRITIKDSFIKGEYLAWYSEDLTFINCTISGTQPFVSSKNIKFIDCTFLKDTDRAFEKSTASGSLKNLPYSLYNPKKISFTVDDDKTIIEKPGSSTNCIQIKKR